MKQYSGLVTGRKALTETGRVGVSGCVAILVTPAVVGLLSNVGVEADPVVVTTVITALGAAGARALTNLYKNRKQI